MTAINTTDLTTKAIDGTGIFDDLMNTVQIRLEREYNKNRIKGTDYSTLYLGAMTAVLQQSIAFLLQKETSGKQADLLTAQIAKTNSEKLLVDQGILNSAIEGANLTKQGLQIVAQTSLIGAQETKLAGVDTLLENANKAKVDAEKLLTDKALLKTEKETLLITQNTANALLTAAVIPKQGNKIDAEIALLSQKTDTEKAQILDTVNSLTVAGVIGKQKDLFTVQKDGFIRDAEQKAAKIVADAWAVRASLDPNAFNLLPGLVTADATGVMAKLKAGVGVV